MNNYLQCYTHKTNQNQALFRIRHSSDPDKLNILPEEFTAQKLVPEHCLDMTGTLFGVTHEHILELQVKHRPLANVRSLF
jgi:hypothetical protein